MMSAKRTLNNNQIFKKRKKKKKKLIRRNSLQINRGIALQNLLFQDFFVPEGDKINRKGPLKRKWSGFS